jgi:large subunit ribosomal protein L11
MIDRGEHPAATQQERAWLREVAMAKLPDLNTADLDAAERIVAGTARSTGVEDQEKDET